MYKKNLGRLILEKKPRHIIGSVEKKHVVLVVQKKKRTCTRWQEDTNSYEQVEQITRSFVHKSR
jgi:hypothetical protein